MMTDGRQEAAWQFCAAVSTRLYEVCMHDASFRSEISRLYRKWQVDEAGTDAKVRLLTSLALYSLLLDRPSSSERDWEQITAASVLDTVAARPVHELFASLPSLSQVEERHLQALKLMSYSFGTSPGPSATANYWAYLTTTVSLLLEQIVIATGEETPTCKTILSAGQ
ncbi:hypothetical protein OG819_58185 [Streptomyces sp. NBC_01549]|uniref:hypothetical protein n=1 Tax=Streptomyces TaxID=1883 RepID=UPI0022537AE1|nr:hypothetical protein [Streptomyces sp. NBC_01549]MCX4598825.1 hypothetical protein [Streptomyces sp. NBC_01549]